MKIVILLLLVIACEPAHKPMALYPEDLKFIRDISEKNEGLKDITLRFGEAYRINFINGSFYVKKADYCFKGNQECITVTNNEINWCNSVCEKNLGIEKLELASSCENFMYMGEVSGGFCLTYKYTWSCLCQNNVKNYQIKTVERIHD